MNIFALFMFFVVENQAILPRRTRRARRTTDLKKISTSRLVAAGQVNSGCLDGRDRYRPEIGSGGGNGKRDRRNREVAIEIAVAVRFAFGIAQAVRRAVYPGAGRSVRPVSTRSRPSPLPSADRESQSRSRAGGLWAASKPASTTGDVEVSIRWTREGSGGSAAMLSASVVPAGTLRSCKSLAAISTLTGRHRSVALRSGGLGLPRRI